MEVATESMKDVLAPCRCVKQAWLNRKQEEKGGLKPPFFYLSLNKFFHGYFLSFNPN